MLSKLSRRAKATRFFGLIFAFVLSFSTLGTAYAAGLANGDFELNYLGRTYCSLHNWTETGAVSVVNMDDEAGNLSSQPDDFCTAKVAAYKSAHGSVSTSMLRQSFSVPVASGPYRSYLQANVWVQSSHPGTRYVSQSITVYDVNNNEIYSKVHNDDYIQMGQLTVDLQNYQGQNVTLEIKTSVGGLSGVTYSGATYIDNIWIGAYGWDGPGAWNW